MDEFGAAQFDTPAQPPEDRTRRQLASMRLLFDPERDPDTHDILLATCFEALASGPKTTEEIVRHVEAVWPGTSVLRETIGRVLGTARDRGFLSESPRLNLTPAWTLADRARLRLDESERWADDVLIRCRSQVLEEAKSSGLSASVDQAERWTRLLLAVLHDGIARAFISRPEATRVVDERLFPPYDRDALLTAVSSQCDTSETRDFLGALALASLDPQSTFGNELVHYIATGYVLYSFMARQDLQGARAEVGSVEGEVVVLDTPIFLRLLGSDATRRATLDVLAKAASAGFRLVVLKRTLSEVAAAIAVRTGTARQIEREMADGVPRLSLLATCSEEILITWLETPGELTWDQFTLLPATIEATLRAIGTATDAEAGFGSIGDSGDLDRFAEAVRITTAARGKERRPEPVAHDAHLLLFVKQSRRSNPQSAAKLWPGALVSTTDRSLNAAYREAEPRDTVNVAVTLSQLAAIVARFAPAADAERLAEAISRETAYEARLARAARIPPAQAIELARTIARDGVDDAIVNAEALQLSFGEILASAGDNADPAAAARMAITRLESRRDGASRTQVEEARREEQRSRERSEADRARAETLAAERSKDRAVISALQAERDMGRHREASLRRRPWVVALYAVALLVVLVLALTDVMTANAVAVSALVGVAALLPTVRWVRNPDEPWWLLPLGATAWAAVTALSILADRSIS